MKLPVDRAVSAGGVVYKLENNEIRILLCGNCQRGIWSLPKGTPDTGESLEETARREVIEETGLQGAIQDKIGEIHYWFIRADKRYSKTVHFYLFSPTGGSLQQHDPEFDVVEWNSSLEALNKLTYKNETEIVKQALEIIKLKYVTGEKKSGKD